MSGGERAWLAASGLAPVLILAAVWLLLSRMSQWSTSPGVPDGYERFDAERFTVYCAPENRKAAKALVDEAGQFAMRTAEAFSPLLGDLTPPDDPIQVTLFGNQKDFATFASSALSEDLSQNGGYFDVVNLEIAVVMTDSAGTRLGIRHEVAHLLLARDGGRRGSTLPPWLNEGLATYLEVADPNAPNDPPDIAQWVAKIAAQTPTAPPIPTITESVQDAFIEAGNEVAYAHANLLVHFLIARDADRFWRFARQSRDGAADTFAETFGSPDQLAAPWEHFVRSAGTSAADPSRRRKAYTNPI
ncbi:MAG: hypothetical protein ACI9OJ_002238 [Myxococcota bacterium]|jgi:hypothetical protein